jgi:hypothetical protein
LIKGHDDKRFHLTGGKVLQTIDNEELIVTIDGNRKRMRKAEIHFRQLFTKAIKADLTAARLIAKEAARYFGPEADGPAEIRWLVVPDDQRTLSPKTEGGPQDKDQAKKQWVENTQSFKSKAKQPASVDWGPISKGCQGIDHDRNRWHPA